MIRPLARADLFTLLACTIGLSACGGGEDLIAGFLGSVGDPSETPAPQTPGPEEELLGELVVREVVDTACATSSSAGIELLPDDPGAPLFSRLSRVGTTWVAAQAHTLPGFLLFDDQGKGADGTPHVLSEAGERVASEGDHLGAVALEKGEVIYRRFGPKGNPVGPSIVVGLGEPHVVPEIVAGEGGALVIWGHDGELWARRMSEGEPMGKAFALGAGFYTTSAEVTGAADGDHYGVAWTSNDGLGFTTYVAILAEDDVVVEPRAVIRTDEVHRVVRLTATAEGFALLLTGPLPEAAPHVILFAPDGASRDGFAHRLEGAFFGWDLASREGELAVLTARASAHPAFRSFDAAMEPRSTWVCLEAPDEAADGGGLAADESGYVALVRRPDAADPSQGTQVFLKLDAAGMPR